MTTLIEGQDYHVVHDGDKHTITHASRKELVFVAFNGDYANGQALTRFTSAVYSYVTKLNEIEDTFGVKFVYGDYQLFLSGFGPEMSLNLISDGKPVINEHAVVDLLEFLDEVESSLLSRSYDFVNYEKNLIREGFDVKVESGRLSISNPLVHNGSVSEYPVTKGKIPLLSNISINFINHLRELAEEALQQRAAAVLNSPDLEKDFKGKQVYPENTIAAKILANAGIRLFENAATFLSGQAFNEDNNGIKYIGANTGYVARALYDCELICRRLRDKGVYVEKSFVNELALHQLGAKVPSEKFINSVLTGAVKVEFLKKLLPADQQHITEGLEELIEEAAKAEKKKARSPSTEVLEARVRKGLEKYSEERSKAMEEIRDLILLAVKHKGGNKHDYKGFINMTIDHANKLPGANINELAASYLKDFSGEKALPCTITHKLECGLVSLVNVIYKTRARENHPEALKLSELVEKHNRALSNELRYQQTLSK